MRLILAPIAALLLATAPAPAAPAPDRLVIGDPAPLLTWLLARPGVRDEIERGGVALFIEARGYDPAALTGLLADPAALLAGLPRRTIIEAPRGIWIPLAQALAGEPPAIPPIAARLDFHDDARARAFAPAAADALGLIADGDTWRTADGLASAGIRGVMTRDGATLTLTVNDAAPPPVGDETALLTARWDATPIAAIDPALRARFIETIGTPGSGRFTLTLGETLEWQSDLPAPPGAPAAALLAYAPAGAVLTYHGHLRFPEDLTSDEQARAQLIAFFADLDAPLSPGVLLVAGPDRPADLDLRAEPVFAFKSSTHPTPALALVLPTAAPARTLDALRERLRARVGIALVPHAIAHGGPTWRLADDWSRPFGVSHADLGGGFESHVFAGPDAIVISTDDALSERIRAARQGKKRRQRPPADVVVLDDGGMHALFRALAAFITMARTLDLGDETSTSWSALLMGTRLAQALGDPRRRGRVTAGRLRTEGRLHPVEAPLPDLGLPVDGRAAIAAWLDAWCHAGAFGDFTEADDFRLVRAPGARPLPMRASSATRRFTRAGHGTDETLTPYTARGPDDATGRAADIEAIRAGFLARPGARRVLALTADLPAWRARDALAAARATGAEAVTVVVADPADAARRAPAPPDAAAAATERARFDAQKTALDRQMHIVTRFEALSARCPAVFNGFEALADIDDDTELCSTFNPPLAAALARCDAGTRDAVFNLLTGMGRGTVRPYGLDRRLDPAPATWARAGTWGDAAPKLMAADAIPIGAP